VFALYGSVDQESQPQLYEDYLTAKHNHATQLLSCLASTRNNMKNIKAVRAVKYKTNITFGKTKRRTMLLYWILKSLACA
jgi:hypothetical protein